jgi:hypothetical protein
VGEESVFWIDSDFAYKNQTVPFKEETLPPNTNMYYWFRITFLERNRMYPVDFEECIEFLEIERLEGNNHYRKKEFKQASSNYNRCKTLLTQPHPGVLVVDSEEKAKMLKDAKIKVFLNIVKVNELLKKYSICIDHATQILSEYNIFDRKDMPQTSDEFVFNACAEMLYLRGKIRRLEESWELGLQDIEHAIEILSKPTEITSDTENTKVEELLEKLQNEKTKLEAIRIRATKDYDRRMGKAMKKNFSEGIYNDAKPFNIEEEWRKKDEEDRKHGRKVWFTSDGMEFVDIAPRPTIQADIEFDKQRN